jgi:hypothetical protein
MKATVVVFKGNPDMEGNRIKMNIMEVLTRFVGKCMPKVDVMSDGVCIVMNFPKAEGGDPQWVVDRVLRRMYWDDASTPAEAEDRAERLYTLFKEAGGTDEVGLGLVERYLSEMYLMEKSASVFKRRFEWRNAGSRTTRSF